jgi:putative Holliday junction resolvase
VSAGRLLGVDYGRVRVGLAISDPDRQFAFPLTTVQRQDRARDASALRTLAVAENVVGLVVGLPVRMDGTEGDAAAAAREFGTWLGEVTGLPVAYFDERFTSVEAEQALWDAGLTHKKRKARRDRVAAQMLLQCYLDAGCPADTGTGPLEG